MILINMNNKNMEKVNIKIFALFVTLWKILYYFTECAIVYAIGGK